MPSKIDEYLHPGMTNEEWQRRVMDLMTAGRLEEASEMMTTAMNRIGLPGRTTLKPSSEKLAVELISTVNHDYTQEESPAVPELILGVRSLELIEKIKREQLVVDELDWRDFERVISQLLEQEGYRVRLGKGKSDGGVDIFADTTLPKAWTILTIWQAKHYTTKKVGLGVIRELADTTLQEGASKGVLVTSSFLTRGALARIQQQKYRLGKVDRWDLLKWIHGQQPT